MQVQSGDESRHVADDIDLFRMQSSYDEADQSQHVTAATIAQSVDSRNCLISYEYRSRDEVANAILKLRGKDKQAEFVNKANPHPLKLQLNTQRDFQTAEVTREPDIVPLSYSSRTWAAPQQQHTSNSLQKTLSVTRSFVSMSVASRALTAEDARSGVVPEQQLSNNPLKMKSSATRSIISMGTKSRATEIEEAGVQVVPDDAQTKSLQNEPKKDMAYCNRTEKEKPDGILRSLFSCGELCAAETQLPDYSAMEEIKEYSVEGISNHVKGLKIETSSQFLSPPPPSTYIHVAPCEVVQHSASIGGCSTITYSVAGKIVTRDEAEKVPDNAATTKHSNLSTCASSLIDRDKEDEGNDKKDDQKAVQVPSNEQLSNVDYESLGLGSKESLSQNHYKSRSASMSYMSVVGNGSSMSGSTVTELDTQTKSQSFSLMSYEDGNTFSSASDSSDSDEDSDYTLTDASCSIDDTYTFASTLHDDSMTYETSLSGSSCASF